MLISLVTSLLLVTVCIFVHFVALRRMGWLLHLSGRKVRYSMLRILFALFGLHLAEVMLYALAMLLLDYWGQGHIDGALLGGAAVYYDFFYFSMASYTTIGIGDIVPHGPLRMIAAIEALNGLVLIAWSASFTYLMMERYWKEGLPDGNGTNSS
jgi:hypothetical protein